MLRRPATTLQITSEDVAAYEDRRAREALAAQEQQQQQRQREAGGDSGIGSRRGTPAATAEGGSAEDEVRRQREERIGVGRRG